MPNIGIFKPIISESNLGVFLLVAVKGPPDNIIPFVSLFLIKFFAFEKLIIYE